MSAWQYYHTSTNDAGIQRGIQCDIGYTDLELKLCVCQEELRDAYIQLEKLQFAEISRLKELKEPKSWTTASTIFEALIRIKEKQRVDSRSMGDKTKATALFKALSKYYEELGEIYMNADNLENAKRCTEKAYDDQVRLLGSESHEARSTNYNFARYYERPGLRRTSIRHRYSITKTGPEEGMTISLSSVDTSSAAYTMNKANMKRQYLSFDASGKSDELTVQA